MAKIDKMVPAIILWEVGINIRSGESNKDLFDRAKVSKGGFTNDPIDSGGATCVGVTIGAYSAYCKKKGYPNPTVERLKAITYEVWRDILKTAYWDRWKADDIKNQSVAEYLVDWTWNSGTHGIKIPQRMIGVKDDGIVGPKTIEAVNNRNQGDFHQELVIERIAFYEGIVKRTPSQAKFLKGWINRAKSFKYKEE